MINRYWTECVEEKATHNGHKIYKDQSGKLVVQFRWGEDLGEDVNKFNTLKAAKSFIDRIVIPQWSEHLNLENMAASYA